MADDKKYKNTPLGLDNEIDDYNNPDETFSEVGVDGEAVNFKINKTNERKFFMKPLEIENIAALRLYQSSREGEIAIAQGYYSRGDIGDIPGYGRSAAASPGTYVDNGCSIIVPNSGNGSIAWLWGNIGSIDVKWCGATGDGATDDTAAIQTALNFRGLIYASPGNYRVQDLEIDSNTTFFGAGPSVTVLESIADTGPATILKTKPGSRFNLKIADMTMNGRHSAGALESTSLLEIIDTSQFILDNLIVIDPYTHCVLIKRSEHGALYSCQALQNTGYSTTPDDGFAVGETLADYEAGLGSKDIGFYSCYARGFNTEGNQSGFEVDDGPTSISYNQCFAEDCNLGFTAHTHTNATQGAPLDNIKYNDCTAQDCDVAGFSVHARAGSQIDGSAWNDCFAENCAIGFRALNIAGVVFRLRANSCVARDCTKGIQNTSTNIYVDDFSTKGHTIDYENTPNVDQYWLDCKPPIPTFDWTPTLEDASANQAAFTLTFAKYQNLPGNLLKLSFRLEDITTAGMTPGDKLLIKGFPDSAENNRALGIARVSKISFGGESLCLELQTSTMLVNSSLKSGGTIASILVSDILGGGSTLFGEITYERDH
ncbi:hypothetical protein KAR91_02205 [Candidatus Pacearchaeota archaeon]|nr:hypothetical protein [Candidatus Pacearchaeota archaeon]